MRHFAPAGWTRVREGLDCPSQITTEAALWGWAQQEGSGIELATAFLLGVLNAEPRSFPGLEEALRGAHPVRIAYSLDSTRRELIADIIRDPRAYIVG